LYPWFFINADHVNAFGFVELGGGGVQFADLLYLLRKLIPILNVGMFPVPASVRL
jgi:hypothetical protein